MAKKYRVNDSAVYGSLAYDLDALVLERQLEEAGAMPQRRAEAAPVQRRRMDAQPKAKTRPSPLLAMGVAAMCALVVVLLLGYVQLTAVGASISQMTNELSDLETEHVALLTEYEKTFDLATIKAVVNRDGVVEGGTGAAKVKSGE